MGSGRGAASSGKAAGGRGGGRKGFFGPVALVKAFIVVLTGLAIVLWVFMMRMARYNADMFFYDRVTRYVGKYYSMGSSPERIRLYRNEREQFLKDNAISLIIAYDSARKILASNTEDIPFSQLRIVETNEIVPLQGVFERSDTAQFIVRSVIDFSLDLDGGYYYVRLNDAQYAETVFRNKMRNDIGVVFLVALGLFAMLMSAKFFQLRDDLKHRNDLVSLGSATRRLAHEIKNPVAAIMMQISLLERLHPDQVEEYGVIKTEGKRIVSLTDRIREFMADPVGSVEMINFLDFMREEVGYFKPGIITANYYVADESSYVHFDRTRLRSVFINVIQNAIDSQSEKEDCKVVVNVSAVQGNSKIKVEILDWGDGVKDSDKPKVFNPFFTTKNVGTGIGLSISKQFLNARGGSIDLSNRIGRDGRIEGAICTIILSKERHAS